MLVIYPENVHRLISSVTPGAIDEPDGVGVEIRLSCGSFVRISLKIDEAARNVTDIRHASNGCGYMVAAAEAFARRIARAPLAKLHGLGPEMLDEVTASELGDVPGDRAECVQAVKAALRAAFAEHRERAAAAAGLQPLLCTCFGVTEHRIDEVIAERPSVTVEEITALTNAGTGCGSCLPLLREIVEMRASLE